MIRLFVALKIPDDIKQEIIELRNSVIPDYQNYKWEKQNKLHFTLKFIGEVEDHLVDTIADKIKFVEEYSPFDCSFTEFGFFFKRKIPKILWMGMKTDDRIYQLVDRLNNELTEFNIPVDNRKFKAHLTLMRIRKKVDNEFIEKFREFKFDKINFKADNIALIKSELLPEGSKYTEIRNYNLK